MGVVSWREINRYFADAYCDAARADADMRAATAALETLRETIFSIPSGTSIIDVWGAFDEQVGSADPDRLMPILVELRQQFQKIAIEREIYRLNRIFDRDKQEGWRQWLETYARSFSLQGWRTAFGLEITRHGLKSYSPSKEWPLSRIRQAAELVDKGRWSETYDWFIFLSEQELQPDLRAQFLATAAEIQLYHFLQPGRAKTLLDQASSLAPDAVRLQIAWGEYWMQKDKLELAKKQFEGVIDVMPKIADGYVNLGDYYDKTNDTTRAEDMYQQAIFNAPGAIDGYRRLMNFHGKTTWFSERENRLQPLFQRILALEDDQSYSWVSLGLIYKENRRYEKALEYFEKAIQEDNRSIFGHIWLGYTHTDQVSDSEKDTNHLDKARASFDRVIQLAPDAIDGYWAIMRLEILQKNWQAALDACNKCLSIHPEWESFVLVGRADIHQQMGRYEDAEQDLLKSLEIEPDNPGALSVFSRLADSYKKTDEKGLSLRALDILLQHKGKPYEHTYHNQIGNMNYYFADYSIAADHYRLALAVVPDDDVLNSNLALAIERQNTPGNRINELEEAIQYLKRARDLNEADQDYTRRLQALEIEYSFISVYGENAHNLSPLATGIRIKVSNDLLPDILTEDQSNLSNSTLQAIDDMRQHIREFWGIELPGILYSYLDETDNNTGRYELYFQEKYQDFGYAEPGMLFALEGDDSESTPDYDISGPPYGHWVKDESEIKLPNRDRFARFLTATEYILLHVERAVINNPLDLLGFQDIINLATDCDEATRKEIRKSSLEMLRYAQVLKQLINARVPLVNIQEISQEYLSLRSNIEDISEIARQIKAKFAINSSL